VEVECVRLRNGNHVGTGEFGLRVQEISWKVSYMIWYILSCEKLAYIIGERIAVEVEKMVLCRPIQSLFLDTKR
jgi:hypothetical protein